MNTTSNPAEQRRENIECQVLAVVVPGRCMIEDKREFLCHTIDFSSDAVSLATTALGRLGERVVVYLDYIGRLEGRILQPTLSGFVLSIALPGNKREKLAQQLTWLVNRETLGNAARRHERIVPNLKHCILHLCDAKEHLVKIIDISMSGAAIATSLNIPIGLDVVLGSTPGRVIRIFNRSIGIEFDAPLPIEQFDEAIRL